MIETELKKAAEALTNTIERHAGRDTEESAHVVCQCAERLAMISQTLLNIKAQEEG